MRIFKETPKFRFIEKRFAYFAVSGVLLAASVGALVTRGINYGIEFTGGSLVQLTFAEKDIGLEAVRSDVRAAGYPDASIQHYVGTSSFAISIKGADEAHASETVDKFVDAFRKARPGREFSVDKKEFVGPSVGRHLYKRAVFAIVFSMLGIVVYVAFRFANPLWGFAGILALAHDILATLGLYAFLQMEVDLVLVAAVLTIAGYSINDTIVIFDRMREKIRTMRRESMAEILDASINETLSRTLITSLTTFLAVIVLYLIGGTVIHDFALTLTFGVVVGTYSSVAVAAPFVYQWEAGRTRKSAAPVKPSGQPVPQAPRGRRERRKRRR